MIDTLYNGFPFKPEIGCFGIGSSYLISDEKNVLFDTGSYGARKKIIQLINNNKIDCVVISHLHFDHCSNLDLFCNTSIPIYISKIEYDNYFINRGIDCDLFSYFIYIEKYLNIILVTNEIEITQNLNIIFTPGHTLGHISLEINYTDKNLLAGDALKTYNDYKNVNLFGNAISKEKYIETKKKIINDYNHIYCGHDGEIIDGVLKNRGDIYEF